MPNYTKEDLYPAWARPARRMEPALGAAAVAALLPFALIGLQRTFRTSALQRVTGEVPEAADPAFPEHVERYTRATFRPGNEVEVLCNGDDTFPRLWSDLEGAERSVEFQVYYAASGRVADRTFGILERGARAGVRVRLLYDPVGCRGLAGEYLDALRRAGGWVYPLRPLRAGGMDRVNHRAHPRIVVVDGEVGYTGDFGLSDSWLGDGRSPGSWRSMNARFRGPVLREHAAAFAVLWAEATGELVMEEAPAGTAVAGGACTALLHTSPSVGSSAAERVWALTLAAARRRCYIASGYFAPNPGQVRLLADAARRGVDVRVLTASARHTDAPPAYWAGRGAYPELIDAGVAIHEYEPSMMHAKSWVVDGVWCSVGALNLDNRSVALNDEVALMVHDAAFGARLEARFREDLGRSRQVTRGDLARSGWRERAKAWGARQLRPLM